MTRRKSDQSSPEISLAKVPAHVARVHFDGVRHTSTALLRKQVRHLFSDRVTNFATMMTAAQEARQRLTDLGVFAELELIVDVDKTQKQDDARAYDVIFACRERKTMNCGVSATTSLDNRASIVTRGAVANVLGGAERLDLDWHFGVGHFQEQQRHLTFSKPLEDLPSVKFCAGLFDSTGEMPWVQLRNRARGAFISVLWPTFAGSHSLQLEGQWRHLAGMGESLPLPLRFECDHLLRWALKHNFVADGRDDGILPTYGGLAKVRQEMAMGGAGQDQAHLLHELQLQWNIPISLKAFKESIVSLQLSSAFGLIRSISANSDISVADRFFIGGPLTLRGFEMRQVGPRTDDADFPTGGRVYGLAAAHLYSTLPFIGGRGFLQHFRLQAFTSAGCVSSREPSWLDPSHLMTFLMDEARLSAGLGLVVRLFGLARLEVNYCLPLRAGIRDVTCPGLQFGFGIEYQ